MARCLPCVLLLIAWLLASPATAPWQGPGSLEAVVARDAVPFSLDAVPAPILDRLARHRVVIVGETHRIREQGDLMAALVRGLHAHGFRQLLLEWPHMAEWLMADHVASTGLVPGFTPDPTMVGVTVLTAIRDFNRTLPEGDRIHVHAVDVNLDEYGGARAFLECLGAVSKHLSDPGPIAPFSKRAYATAAEQTAALTDLGGALQAARAALATAWGTTRYDFVAEMVEVELMSVSIRARRKSHADETTREREAAMKRLADRRLEGYAHKTIVTVGSTHAQKARLIGTRNVDWLGDHLTRVGAASSGGAFTLCVTPARVLSATTPPAEQYDIAKRAPAGELWRSLHEAFPGRAVFLAFDDPVFSERELRMQFDDTTTRGVPKRHFDGIIQLPLTHRVPSR